MSRISRAAAALPTQLRPPTGIRERTRWLFALLCLVFLSQTCLPAITSSHASITLIAAASAVWLAVSWIRGFVTRSVPLGYDVVDAGALLGLTLTSPTPAAVLPMIFGVIWYRSLYGSTRRSLLRSALYLLAIAAAVPLWHSMAGHQAPIAAIDLFGGYPFLLCTVLVGRQLSAVLAANEASTTRNTVLAATGTRLLGITDARAIRNLAWEALSDICAVTSGMCLVATVEDGGQLQVRRITGNRPPNTPATLPAGVLDGPYSTVVRDERALNDALGTTLRWRHLRTVDDGLQWSLLVGAHRSPSDDVLVALRSLANQLTMAFGNSDRHAELRARASVDVLTGLVNREAFTAHLGVRADAGPASRDQLLFIDLDDFKLVNDRMGHQAGDKVLIEVARRIRSCSRPDDLCARLGGDEFAILLPATSADDAARIAQRMVERIAEPIDVGGLAPACVGASIGINAGDNGTDVLEVVHRADVAMYAAKALGKGRVQAFSAGLLDTDTSHVDVERRIGKAVDAGAIVVHYQPIVTVADRSCRAVEALVRWQHPDRGLLEPHDFLPAAERTGAIIGIGAFVLRRACLDAVALADARPDDPPLTMHVNVSATELEHDQFIATVADCLVASGLPADRLVLELTDTLALNSVTTISRVTALARLGVTIAIDDVGSGQFPLAALRSLPIGVIKLDQAFLDSAAVTSIDRVAAEAIMHMSSQLGLQTIAEGAERIDQLAWLEALGVDAVQGYLHLRAVPVTQLRDWLGTERTDAASDTVIELRKKATA